MARTSAGTLLMRNTLQAAASRLLPAALRSIYSQKCHYTLMSHLEASTFQPAQLLQGPLWLHYKDKTFLKLILNYALLGGNLALYYQLIKLWRSLSQGQQSNGDGATIGFSPFLLLTWDGWTMLAIVRGPGICNVTGFSPQLSILRAITNALIPQTG